MEFAVSTKPVNVEEYRIRAQRRLPKIIFGYLEGGADDEIGMKHNREVFDRYRLMPRRLVDVSKRDTGIELFRRLAVRACPRPTNRRRREFAGSKTLDSPPDAARHI
jgi:hypothetical protein